MAGSKSPDTRIDPSKLICLPDSILRKAAAQLLKLDEDELVIAYSDKNLAILNTELGMKDSIIGQKNLQLSEKTDIIKTWQDKYFLSVADKQAVKEDYSHFKKKDVTKMAVCGAFIVLCLSGWFSKK